MPKRETTHAADRPPFRKGTWGGARPGAGRRPKPDKDYVPHRTRAPLASRFPVHVTVRVRKGLPRLRTRRVRDALLVAFSRGCERFGFRLIHYSVQANHLHLICEANDRGALSRGLQGLLVRVARALNRAWTRQGPVFAERYHDRILRTPREVWRVLRYVLNNAQRHGHRFVRRVVTAAGTRVGVVGLDPHASGWWFDGWRERPTIRGLERIPRPVAAARTWLLRTGWRRHGLIPLGDAPG